MDEKKANSKVSQGTEADVNNTSSKSQCARLLKRLQQSRITTFEARSELNIMHPSARIQELKAAGHDIHTQELDAYDNNGCKHPRVAHYTLISLAGNSTDGRGAE